MKFCYLKILHILHLHYRSKIPIILKICKKTSVRSYDHILEIIRLIIMKIRMRMKRRSGLDLTTRDSHFTILVQVFTNHILAKNTYFTNHIELTEHKIMVLNLETSIKYAFPEFDYATNHSHESEA